MRMEHSGTGTQRNRYTMGLVHNKSGTQRDWDTTDDNGTQAAGLGHKGNWYTLELGQWDLDTAGPIHNKSGREWTNPHFISVKTFHSQTKIVRDGMESGV